MLPLCTVENEATGMVVNLESGRADGGEGREVNHEPTVPGLHLVPDHSSCWSQTRGDLEVEYWRERERYLNDLEYDSDAWDRYERDHDRHVCQLMMSQRFSNVSQK